MVGTTTGQLVIVSTALANGTAVINLSGTGVLFGVDLTWYPPCSSPDPVAGYNIYRSLDGGNSYQLLNSLAAAKAACNVQVAYSDANNLLSGQTYDYVVESVDASGVTSAPSNMASVSIP
jgi:fibronectin type 3 domain-containing protein